MSNPQVCMAAGSVNSCVDQDPPATQCDALTTENTCNINNLNIVCGTKTINGSEAKLKCNGKNCGGPSCNQTSICCNSSSATPWYYSYTGSFNQALCASLDNPVCPVIGPGSGPGLGPEFCVTPGPITDFSSISTTSISSGFPTRDLAYVCQYPIDVFNTAENVQKYVEAFGTTGDQYGKKIMPHFCGMDADPSMCPVDKITGEKMTKCSNMVVNQLCKNWIDGAVKEGTFEQSVEETMKNYCNANPTWANECKCINRAGDPIFDELKEGISANADCFYLPCATGVFLKPPIEFPQPPKKCPPITCSNVNINIGNTNLTEKQITESTTCTDKNGGTPTSGTGNGTGESFWDANKAWIIPVLVIAGVIILILIVGIIIASVDKSKKKKIKTTTTIASSPSSSPDMYLDSPPLPDTQLYP